MHVSITKDVKNKMLLYSNKVKDYIPCAILISIHHKSNSNLVLNRGSFGNLNLKGVRYNSILTYKSDEFYIQIDIKKIEAA